MNAFSSSSNGSMSMPNATGIIERGIPARASSPSRSHSCCESTWAANGTTVDSSSSRCGPSASLSASSAAGQRLRRLLRRAGTATAGTPGVALSMAPPTSSCWWRVRSVSTARSGRSLHEQGIEVDVLALMVVVQHPEPEVHVIAEEHDARR